MSQPGEKVVVRRSEAAARIPFAPETACLPVDEDTQRSFVRSRALKWFFSRLVVWCYSFSEQPKLCKRVLHLGQDARTGQSEWVRDTRLRAGEVVSSPPQRQLSRSIMDQSLVSFQISRSSDCFEIASLQVTFWLLRIWFLWFLVITSLQRGILYCAYDIFKESISHLRKWLPKEKSHTFSPSFFLHRDF